MTVRVSAVVCGDWPSVAVTVMLNVPAGVPGVGVGVGVWPPPPQATWKRARNKTSARTTMAVR